jgi:hypothetical protein
MRALKVVRQRDAGRSRLFEQKFGDAPVARLSTKEGLTLVQTLSHQGMLEMEGGMIMLDGREDMCGVRLIQSRSHNFTCDVGGTLDEREWCALTDNGSILQQALCDLAEPIQPLLDQLLNEAWDAEVSGGLTVPCVVIRPEHAALFKGEKRLDREEGVAFDVLLQPGTERFALCVVETISSRYERSHFNKTESTENEA